MPAPEEGDEGARAREDPPAAAAAASEGKGSATPSSFADSPVLPGDDMGPGAESSPASPKGAGRCSGRGQASGQRAIGGWAGRSNARAASTAPGATWSPRAAGEGSGVCESLAARSGTRALQRRAHARGEGAGGGPERRFRTLCAGNGRQRPNTRLRFRAGPSPGARAACSARASRGLERPAHRIRNARWWGWAAGQSGWATRAGKSLRPPGRRAWAIPAAHAAPERRAGSGSRSWEAPGACPP